MVSFSLLVYRYYGFDSGGVRIKPQKARHDLTKLDLIITHGPFIPLVIFGK